MASSANGLNIVVPMAGLGSRFSKAGYCVPKPFLDIFGKSMIQCVVENLDVSRARYILLARGEHLFTYKSQIESAMGKRLHSVVPIERLTEGAACTVLHARGLIDNDTPLLIANSDQIVDINIGDYVHDMVARKLDGSILVFKDEKLDPKWSFAKLGADGLVSEVQEKKPISDFATVGIYLFSKGSHFVDAAIDMIARNDRVNNEFYVCPVYNYLIRAGFKIGVYEIKESQMHGTGTPEDFERYKKMIAKAQHKG